MKRGSRDGVEVCLALEGGFFFLLSHTGQGSSVGSDFLSLPACITWLFIGCSTAVCCVLQIWSWTGAEVCVAVSQKECPPTTWECSSVWIKGLYGCHEGKDPSCWVHWVESWVLELRSFWIRVNPTSDDKCPQGKEEDREKATWSWRLSLEFAARSLAAPRS